MRRTILIIAATATLAATGWAAARGTSTQPSPATPAAHQHPSQTAAAHQHLSQLTPTTSSHRRDLAAQLARARLATARYATSLPAARADGYQIITRMIPDMGWHFLNPTVRGFDVTRPPILVYERRGRSWQLGALEWVFRTRPATPPLPGATYGSFAAACHYKDGTFVPASSQDQCPTRSPETGARFNFWHPDLVTLHVWLWYPNPAGLYSGINPYVRPFNRG